MDDSIYRRDNRKKNADDIGVQKSSILKDYLLKRAVVNDIAHVHFSTWLTNYFYVDKGWVLPSFIL